MSGILDWLTTLPDVVLYLVIAVAAFAENVFPPLPADSVVALGAFVSARGNGTALGAWIATMIGNMSGAILMFYIGRRFGLPWLSQRIPVLAGPEAESRFRSHYMRYGIPGIVLSRFLPGVRAIVPPVAGALRVPAGRALTAMAIASGAWYAMVCALAFKAGEHADVLLDRIASHQRSAAIVAAVVLAISAIVFVVKRKRGGSK